MDNEEPTTTAGSKKPTTKGEKGEKGGSRTGTPKKPQNVPKGSPMELSKGGSGKRTPKKPPEILPTPRAKVADEYHPSTPGHDLPGTPGKGLPEEIISPARNNNIPELLFFSVCSFFNEVLNSINSGKVIERKIFEVFKETSGKLYAKSTDTHVSQFVKSAEKQFFNESAEWDKKKKDDFLMKIGHLLQKAIASAAGRGEPKLIENDEDLKRFVGHNTRKYTPVTFKRIPNVKMNSRYLSQKEGDEYPSFVAFLMEAGSYRGQDAQLQQYGACEFFKKAILCFASLDESTRLELWGKEIAENTVVHCINCLSLIYYCKSPDSEQELINSMLILFADLHKMKPINIKYVINKYYLPHEAYHFADAVEFLFTMKRSNKGRLEFPMFCDELQCSYKYANQIYTQKLKDAPGVVDEAYQQQCLTAAFREAAREFCLAGRGLDAELHLENKWPLVMSKKVLQRNELTKALQGNQLIQGLLEEIRNGNFKKNKGLLQEELKTINPSLEVLKSIDEELEAAQVIPLDELSMAKRVDLLKRSLEQYVRVIQFEAKPPQKDKISGKLRIKLTNVFEKIDVHFNKLAQHLKVKNSKSQSDFLRALSLEQVQSDLKTGESRFFDKKIKDIYKPFSDLLTLANIEDGTLGRASLKEEPLEQLLHLQKLLFKDKGRSNPLLDSVIQERKDYDRVGNSYVPPEILPNIEELQRGTLREPKSAEAAADEAEADRLADEAAAAAKAVKEEFQQIEKLFEEISQDSHESKQDKAKAQLGQAKESLDNAKNALCEVTELAQAVEQISDASKDAQGLVAQALNDATVDVKYASWAYEQIAAAAKAEAAAEREAAQAKAAAEAEAKAAAEREAAQATAAAAAAEREAAAKAAQELATELSVFFEKIGTEAQPDGARNLISTLKGELEQIELDVLIHMLNRVQAVNTRDRLDPAMKILNILEVFRQDPNLTAKLTTLNNAYIQAAKSVVAQEAQEASKAVAEEIKGRCSNLRGINLEQVSHARELVEQTTKLVECASKRISTGVEYASYAPEQISVNLNAQGQAALAAAGEAVKRAGDDLKIIEIAGLYNSVMGMMAMGEDHTGFDNFIDLTIRVFENSDNLAKLKANIGALGPYFDSHMLQDVSEELKIKFLAIIDKYDVDSEDGTDQLKAQLLGLKDDQKVARLQLSVLPSQGNTDGNPLDQLDLARSLNAEDGICSLFTRNGREEQQGEVDFVEVLNALRLDRSDLESIQEPLMQEKKLAGCVSRLVENNPKSQDPDQVRKAVIQELIKLRYHVLLDLEPDDLDDPKTLKQSLNTWIKGNHPDKKQDLKKKSDADKDTVLTKMIEFRRRLHDLEPLERYDFLQESYLENLALIMEFSKYNHFEVVQGNEGIAVCDKSSEVLQTSFRRLFDKKAKKIFTFFSTFKVDPEVDRISALSFRDQVYQYDLWSEFLYHLDDPCLSEEFKDQVIPKTTYVLLEGLKKNLKENLKADKKELKQQVNELFNGMGSALARLIQAENVLAPLGVGDSVFPQNFVSVLDKLLEDHQGSCVVIDGSVFGVFTQALKALIEEDENYNPFVAKVVALSNLNFQMETLKNTLSLSIWDTYCYNDIAAEVNSHLADLRMSMDRRIQQLEDIAVLRYLSLDPSHPYIVKDKTWGGWRCQVDVPYILALMRNPTITLTPPNETALFDNPLLHQGVFKGSRCNIIYPHNEIIVKCLENLNLSLKEYEYKQLRESLMLLIAHKQVHDEKPFFDTLMAALECADDSFSTINQQLLLGIVAFIGITNLPVQYPPPEPEDDVQTNKSPEFKHTQAAEEEAIKAAKNAHNKAVQETLKALKQVIDTHKTYHSSYAPPPLRLRKADAPGSGDEGSDGSFVIDMSSQSIVEPQHFATPVIGVRRKSVEDQRVSLLGPQSPDDFYEITVSTRNGGQNLPVTQASDLPYRALDDSDRDLASYDRASSAAAFDRDSSSSAAAFLALVAGVVGGEAEVVGGGGEAEVVGGVAEVVGGEEGEGEAACTLKWSPKTLKWFCGVVMLFFLGCLIYFKFIKGHGDGGGDTECSDETRLTADTDKLKHTAVYNMKTNMTFVLGFWAIKAFGPLGEELTKIIYAFNQTIAVAFYGKVDGVKYPNCSKVWRPVHVGESLPTTQDGAITRVFNGSNTVMTYSNPAPAVINNAEGTVQFIGAFFSGPWTKYGAAICSEGRCETVSPRNNPTFKWPSSEFKLLMIDDTTGKPVIFNPLNVTQSSVGKQKENLWRSAGNEGSNGTSATGSDALPRTVKGTYTMETSP